MLVWELAIPGPACIPQPGSEGPSPGHVTQQDGQLLMCIVGALPLRGAKWAAGMRGK